MTPTYLFEEIWKVIPSDSSLEASNWGRIRILPHSKIMPHGGFRAYGGEPTFGQWDGERFLYCRKGYKTRKVAILVCEAFHGPKPFLAAVVMHDDENSRNNTPDNLKWGTQKENLSYPEFIKYCHGRTGDNNPHRKGRDLL